MEKVLLTGGTGFVGSHAAEKLLEDGVTPTLLVRRENSFTEALKKRGAQIIKGGFTDSECLKRSVDENDTVIHIAGATRALNEKDMMRVNVEYTERLLEQSTGRRFIYMSSQAAAGPADEDLPMTESREEHPLTWYGKSKLAAEEKVKKWGESNDGNFAIIRPPAVYGPREKDIFNYFKLINMGLMLILGTGEKKFSIIYVKDLVDATLTAAKTPRKGDTFFVCNSHSPSWNELSLAIKKAIGKDSVLRLKVPEAFVYPLGYASEFISMITRKPALLSSQKLIEMKQDAWICSGKLITELLDWKPSYSLEKGIKETAEWYKKEGWI